MGATSAGGRAGPAAARLRRETGRLVPATSAGGRTAQEACRPTWDAGTLAPATSAESRTEQEGVSPTWWTDKLVVARASGATAETLEDRDSQTAGVGRTSLRDFAPGRGRSTSASIARG